MDFDSLRRLLDQAIASRRNFCETSHEEAFRLFNGFYEGFPDLVLDIYGQTLVIYDFAEQPKKKLILEIADHVRSSLNWLRACLLKSRSGKTRPEQCGVLLFGDEPDRKINEHGVWFAIDLAINRDAGFYLDTRNLRKWILVNAHGKSVFNSFAYTGSLGIAAAAGRAANVVQTDLNRRFLDLAKDSLSLNNLPIHKKDFMPGDFFSVVARMKSTKRTFDWVILDPPFFSATTRGKIDMLHESERLINKVRPLINDGGVLIAINNALYLSGREYLQTLESVCKDGYLSIRELIPVPEDFIGYQPIGMPITDPAPFNHSTKIAVLDVRRKG